MPRKPPPGKSLAEVNPELAKEWHPTKNGDLTPYDVTHGVTLKVWWKCPEGDDHEWMATINSRHQGNGCGICRGLVVVPSNSLAKLNKDLAAEWHSIKNGELTPYDVSISSNKKVWWKCPEGDDHEWQASVANRSKGRGCRICSNFKVVKSNCLTTTNLKLANEWHPTKNGELQPSDVHAGQNKIVWWKCPEGDDHEWRASIKSRHKGNGCPICSGHTVVSSNSLAELNKDLSAEWHSIQNGELTPHDVSISSNKKVWWKCPEGDDHEWQASVANRSKGHGCPICSNKKVVPSNAIVTTHPSLVDEWHIIRNKGLSPNNISGGSHTKIWWVCKQNDEHIWKARVSARTNGAGCPYCANLKIIKSNSLGYLYPELIKEWSKEKNGDVSIYSIAPGSSKKYWWKCSKGIDHIWMSSPNKRTSGQGCPYCTLTPQSRQELIITFELLTIFKGINPKGFKTRVGGKLWSIDTFIPSLNVGIEFDGAYWHKDKAQLDKVKTEQIEETGLNLIRVRQKPLERLFEDDVMAEKKFDGKQITNDILRQIVKDDGKYAYKLNKRTLDKIDKYLKLEGLQNEKGLDKYIDQILTEKAERKK